MSLDELETEALNLPEKDRVHLFSRLLLSFEPDRQAGEVASVWAEEAERRDRAMETGEEPGIPAEEVFTKLRATLR